MKNIVLKGEPNTRPDLATKADLLPTNGNEQLLNTIDILTAINYYGITELLDIIGEEEIRSYLAHQMPGQSHP